MPSTRRKVLVIRLISWMTLVLVIRAFPPHILYLRTNYNEHRNEFDADIENYVQSIDCHLQDYVDIISFLSVSLRMFNYDWYDGINADEDIILHLNTQIECDIL